MKAIIILRCAPFCEWLATLFTLSSVRCNKYLDISWSQHEQWIYIQSRKLKYAYSTRNALRLARIFAGVLSEWISLSFPGAYCHSLLVWQKKSSLSNNSKPAIVVVLFTAPPPTMFGWLTDWTLLNCCGITLIYNLAQVEPLSLECHVTELRCIPEFGGWGALW